ncbi:keratin-associated protein 5-1-like [Rhineura floridana]|uniref:keratin-associated protein 5-1-like n=1 Tax=Rhineura floridana TaxID=261503 RepID=UPI002AC86E76|nr:keratin-associated protein 5-1-like [Rhineura floridana]XP_061461930.1 keratin-associated protein 5-1-like [Rhineura floridana]
MSEEGVIYSSGREPYYNLNSTWYDPAGSWLDTRRKPFRYADNTACVTCCNPRCDIPRRGGHDYRCYCYCCSTCESGCNSRVTCCVHNPSGGPRDYWGRPIGDACNGCTGGHYSNEDSCCGSCGGTSGGCGAGQGGACAQPSVLAGGCGGGRGVCSEPGCRSSGGCGGGRGVCSEPGCRSSGGCGGGRGVCSEPGCHSSGGYPPQGTGVCAEPLSSYSGGCGNEGRASGGC